MKFTALFALGLATSAVANPTVVARDASEVKQVIANVGKSVDALAAIAASWAGGDYSKIQSASDDLIATINKGVETVNAGGKLSATDALDLTSPVQDLTKKVQATIDGFIAKKSQAEAAGAAGKVKKGLDAQYSAAQSLSDSISSKVPPELSDIAKQLSSGITKAIQKGIDAYKDAKDNSSTASASAPATKTGDSSSTGTSNPTTSGSGSSATSSGSSVLKSTSSGVASSSAKPSPTSSGSGSGSGGSTSTSTSGSSSGSKSGQPPLATGAASSNRVSFTLGGAVAAAALVAAF